jgi:hypothetical protein
VSGTDESGPATVVVDRGHQRLAPATSATSAASAAATGSQRRAAPTGARRRRIALAGKTAGIQIARQILQRDLDVRDVLVAFIDDLLQTTQDDPLHLARHTRHELARRRRFVVKNGSQC